MVTQTYFGLENDADSWLLVQRSSGKTLFLKSFINTIDCLNELAKFIKNSCAKPKIYIKSTGCSVLGLLKYLCGIPDVEVMLVSPAGFKQYQACLPKTRASHFETPCGDAQLLADYAERII